MAPMGPKAIVVDVIAAWLDLANVLIAGFLGALRCGPACAAPCLPWSTVAHVSALSWTCHIQKLPEPQDRCTLQGI